MMIKKILTSGTISIPFCLNILSQSKIDQKIDSLLNKLTLEEKINMIHGSGIFISGGVPRLGIPEITMSDGPSGVRMEINRENWMPAGWNNDNGTYFPSQTALAATWDTSLARQFGIALGQESKIRGKNIQLTPGINSINGNTNEMSIHGFAPGNKSVLVDGVEMYYPTHIYNSISVIQSDIVSSTRLLSNEYPANYGGKLFSVIDISLKEGDMQNYFSSAEINPITAKFKIEGPIIKNKLSFILSNRYNYSSLIGDNWNDYKNTYVNNLDKLVSFNSIGFYDIYAKLTFNLNDKNKFIYLISNNSDNLNSPNVGFIKCNTEINKFLWKHLFNESLYVDNSMSYSNHSYSNKQEVQNPYILSDGISELTLKSDFNYTNKSSNYIKFGISDVLNQIKPFSFVNADTSHLYNEYRPDTKKSITTSIYFEDKQTIADFITINCGVRYNTFSSFGKDSLNQYQNDNYNLAYMIGSKKYSNWQTISFFQSLEPRINIEFKLNTTSFLNISYSYAKQYIHNLPISELYNTDIWYPSNKYLKPEAANHFSVGYNYCFLNGNFNVGIESYLALIENVNEVINGGSLLMNPHLETDIAVGSGKSYGLEVILKKNVGRLSGWLSYTLSNSFLQSNSTFIDKQINLNKQYPSPYHQLHNLAVVVFYEIKSNWVLTSNYNFISGIPTTLPPMAYSFYGMTTIQYSDRNKYQLPSYNRFDISTTYQFELKKYKRQSELSIGVYNLFGKKYFSGFYYNYNQFYYSLQEMNSGGIIPYIKYRYLF